MLSREEQIGRLQSTLRDLEEDCTKKESSLQKLERDLMSVEDMKHKTDDSVSIDYIKYTAVIFENGTWV